MTYRRSFLTVSLLFVLGAAVFAQAHRAIILGQVTDRTGAPIPAAAVKVIHVETNVASATTH